MVGEIKKEALTLVFVLFAGTRSKKVEVAKVAKGGASRKISPLLDAVVGDSLYELIHKTWGKNLSPQEKAEILRGMEEKIGQTKGGLKNPAVQNSLKNIKRELEVEVRNWEKIATNQEAYAERVESSKDSQYFAPKIKQIRESFIPFIKEIHIQSRQEVIQFIDTLLK